MRETPWEGVGHIVVSRDDEQRSTEAVQELSSGRVLTRPASVAEVAADDHKLGFCLLDQSGERDAECRIVRGFIPSEVQV